MKLPVLVACLGGFLLTAAGVTTVRASAADLDALLKNPLSPGGVVLLVEHGSDPRVQARWRAGLIDVDSRVRAASARAIAISRATTLAPSVLAALAAESDLNVGVEEIRAVLMLDPSANAQQLLEASRRLGPQAVEAFYLTTARGRGKEVLDSVFSERDREVLQARATFMNPDFPKVTSAVHSLGDLPAGVFSDVLKVAKCKPRNTDEITDAEIRYDRFGRAQEITVHMPRSTPSACEPPFRALFASALDVWDPHHQAATSEPHVVFMLLSKDHITCLDGGGIQTMSTLPEMPIGELTAAQQILEKSEGKRTREVEPQYPSMATPVGGIVEMQAIVAVNGCVPYLRVRSSPSLTLSSAALEAISQWAFEPFRWNGIPQAVPIRGEVDFLIGTKR